MHKIHPSEMPNLILEQDEISVNLHVKVLIIQKQFNDRIYKR
jgi:hypothetical protein